MIDEAAREQLRQWVLALPFRTYGGRGQLPTGSGLYFLLSEGQVLYVGETGNLWRRLRYHPMFIKVAGRRALRIAFLETGVGGFERSDLERLFISTLLPPMNGNKELSQLIREAATDYGIVEYVMGVSSGELNGAEIVSDWQWEQKKSRAQVTVR